MVLIKQAVILAGGKGTRLAPFTETNPKPMYPINGRPFLEYLVEMLQTNGIKEIVMLLGYLPEKITGHFDDGAKFGVSIKYSITPVEYETGARLKQAMALLDEHFLMMNCDSYLPLNLPKFLAFHNQAEALVSVAVYNNKDGFSRSNMLVGEDDFVKKYDRTRKTPGLNGVELGQWLVNKKALTYLPKHNAAFAEEVQPLLISLKQVRAYRTDHPYYSADRPERIPATEKFLRPKKVIFLDRDGTINKSRGVPGNPDYVKNPTEFEFLPGAITAIQQLAASGYQIYVISNQPGIARGLMTETDLTAIHSKMQDGLKAVGVDLAGIYYCPHGWQDGCDCRKPKPGMFIRAAREHYIDLTKAVMIGDNERDVQASEAAGCRMLLLQPGQTLLEIVQAVI